MQVVMVHVSVQRHVPRVVLCVAGGQGSDIICRVGRVGNRGRDIMTDLRRPTPARQPITFTAQLRKLLEPLVVF